MSIFDQICKFADKAWRDMLCFHGIEGAEVGEYEISGLVIEFFATINGI